MPSTRPNQITKTTKTSELPPALAVSELPGQPDGPVKKTTKSPAGNDADALARLLDYYEYGSVEFAGSRNASYERHLVFDNVSSIQATGPRERFEAFARSVRDILSQRWVRTEETYARKNPKRIYYLSMMNLIWRSLATNVTNLLLDRLAKQACKEKNLDLAQ